MGATDSVIEPPDLVSVRRFLAAPRPGEAVTKTVAKGQTLSDWKTEAVTAFELRAGDRRIHLTILPRS